MLLDIFFNVLSRTGGEYRLLSLLLETIIEKLHPPTLRKGLYKDIDDIAKGQKRSKPKEPLVFKVLFSKSIPHKKIFQSSLNFVILEYHSWKPGCRGSWSFNQLPLDSRLPFSDSYVTIATHEFRFQTNESPAIATRTCSSRAGLSPAPCTIHLWN